MKQERSILDTGRLFQRFRSFTRNVYGGWRNNARVSHMATTLPELIKSKKIPPIILVGIEKTQDTRNLVIWSGSPKNSGSL
ncbi:hypothetical protein [Chryseobacterium tongliaoense]|uniref:hypothetical protein n=1 Tax=Chryseobacterium tongliaoense TaxID=3240933 RepID=UPI00351431FA